MNRYTFYNIIHWLLLATVVLYMFSGFGITYFRVVETITFGVFTKPIAFIVHDSLTIPFIVLLIAHIVLALVLKKQK